jgi:hypothetical protein
MTTIERSASLEPGETLDPLTQRLSEIEQRIARLEAAAHTEHSLSAETINQIVHAAVLRVNSHFQRILGLGKALLQEDTSS